MNIVILQLYYTIAFFQYYIKVQYNSIVRNEFSLINVFNNHDKIIIIIILFFIIFYMHITDPINKHA